MHSEGYLAGESYGNVQFYSISNIDGARYAERLGDTCNDSFRHFRPRYALADPFLQTVPGK